MQCPECGTSELVKPLYVNKAGLICPVCWYHETDAGVIAADALAASQRKRGAPTYAGLKDLKFIVACDTFDGKNGAICPTFGKTFYNVGQINEQGVIEFVDYGYGSIAEAHKAWPDAILFLKSVEGVDDEGMAGRAG